MALGSREVRFKSWWGNPLLFMIHDLMIAVNLGVKS